MPLKYIGCFGVLLALIACFVLLVVHLGRKQGEKVDAEAVIDVRGYK